MRKPVSLAAGFGLAALVAVLGGCSQGNDLRQWVAQEKAKKGAPLEPLPIIKTFETFEYKDQDLRDPFNVSAEEQEQSANNGPHPDQDRPREPLEAFPLDGLRMAGTLGLAKSIEGLVRDPDGVVHRVHVGNYLGQNYGRITSISEDHIDLVELVPNGSGGWMEKPATIALGDTQK
ncbi:MAG TPA: pilus assembly protein PilP [Rhodanobacteraceae bacterium]|jgi:type IV pilus assembly protein PilP|nr:pilus assembly protein PilP [Rhodanobacteraceae bacterium]